MIDRFRRPKPKDIECDIVIIGAGPAGITAAKILKENGLDVWVLGSIYESQLAKAGPLVNIKRLPEGTIGLDYMEKMIEEAKELGVKNKTSLCTGIEINNPFIIKTKHQKFIAPKILISTGCKQTALKFLGEAEFLHRGISDCTVCDWGLFRNKKIAVVGNHEYTLRAANFMKKHVSSIHLLWYNKEENIEEDGFLFYSNVRNLKAFGGETLEKIIFQTDKQEHEIEIDGLFVEGKPKPTTKFLAETDIELNDGYIVVKEDYQTNIEGIWAVGDVTGKSSSYDEAVEQAEKAARNILEY